MKLGPIQLSWLKELREHPERQLTGHLGTVYLDQKGEPNSMKLCCLGQLKICYLQATKSPIAEHLDGFQLTDCSTIGSGYLYSSYNNLGLADKAGSFTKTVELPEYSIYGFSSLSNMNDAGVPWPAIAKYVEEHPEEVFVRSV